MGFFSKVASGAMGLVMGGGGSGGGEALKRVDSIINRYAPGIIGKDEMVKELIEMGQEGYSSARAHDSPQNSGIKIVDAAVNGVNRLIRPGVTIGLIGGLFGWWEMPDPDGIDPRYWDMLQIVMVFWFGGRAIFSDLPKALGYLRGLKGRK